MGEKNFAQGSPALTKIHSCGELAVPGLKPWQPQPSCLSIIWTVAKRLSALPIPRHNFDACNASIRSIVIC